MSTLPSIITLINSSATPSFTINHLTVPAPDRSVASVALHRLSPDETSLLRSTLQKYTTGRLIDLAQPSDPSFTEGLQEIVSWVLEAYGRSEFIDRLQASGLIWKAWNENRGSLTLSGFGLTSFPKTLYKLHLPDGFFFDGNYLPEVPKEMRDWTGERDPDRLSRCEALVADSKWSGIVDNASEYFANALPEAEYEKYRTRLRERLAIAMRTRSLFNLRDIILLMQNKYHLGKDSPEMEIWCLGILSTVFLILSINSFYSLLRSLLRSDNSFHPSLVAVWILSIISLYSEQAAINSQSAVHFPLEMGLYMLFLFALSKCAALYGFTYLDNRTTTRFRDLVNMAGLERPYYYGHRPSRIHHLCAKWIGGLKGQIPDSLLVALKNAYELAAKKDCFNQSTLNKILGGELVILSVGYQGAPSGHAVDLVFYKDRMMICNKGDRPRGAKPLILYKYDPTRWNSYILQNLERLARVPTNNGALHQQAYLYAALPLALDAEEIPLPEAMMCKDQKIGNCTVASAKLAFKAAAFLMQGADTEAAVKAHYQKGLFSLLLRETALSAVQEDPLIRWFYNPTSLIQEAADKTRRYKEKRLRASRINTDLLPASLSG